MHPDHRRYYAPALGFLMFAVGVNSSEKDFLKAFKRPTSVLAGYTGQFLVKPLLGYVFGFIAVAIFGLPTPVGFVSKYVMLFGHFCLHYLCVGAPLAINIEPAMSPFGLTVLLLFIACYLTAFIAGCFLTGVVFHTTPDVKALQRTLSYETGMQRNLLALANRVFQDLQSL
ncbi:probable sodium/metabolite cotransporter BASS5, chloroplastic isoform X1 [Malus sylvestris]|uniref:probable sodium/metabolite cotransporter BASS5, chloroplastic isoform X1 n=2 Tax=Malus sylvestris TaxID=3752 RepID=UPI0021ABC702|nr:probable sodium/metabolite cotransporter BASS5, chloroplastic isoform X1 [Malus sylvestris]